MAESKVWLVLEVDPADANPTDSTGLTEDAYNRLLWQLATAGFGLAEGPYQLGAEDDADQAQKEKQT